MRYLHITLVAVALALSNITDTLPGPLAFLSVWESTIDSAIGIVLVAIVPQPTAVTLTAFRVASAAQPLLPSAVTAGISLFLLLGALWLRRRQLTVDS
jgi:hypothetical protein